MDETSNGPTRDLVSPSPPRWKGLQSLDLVYQLNERCIQLLREIAANAPTATPTAVTENRELWIRLDQEAQRRAARMPFVIVDAHFKEEAWWRRVAESQTRDAGSEEASNGLSREASEHLMHEAAMFAWQTARWDRIAAQMSLGMSPAVAKVIATLTPQQIRTVAVRDPGGIRVRWADDARFWRDLLTCAQAGNNEELAELHLHAKLLLCGELSSTRILEIMGPRADDASSKSNANAQKSVARWHEYTR